jgi:hypothetical protein
VVVVGALVLVPVLLAVVVGIVVSRSGSGNDGAAVETVDLDAVDSIPVGSVADMVGAADCVLRGEVVHTEPGREVGNGLRSRLVQIQVGQALAGECPSGTVVVEEEGWLDDTEVTVEGWPGSIEGDDGVWFLLAGTSDELPYASTVSVNGAPRWRDGDSVAPASAPQWLQDATSAGPDALAASVRQPR